MLAFLAVLVVVTELLREMVDVQSIMEILVM